MNTKRYIKKLTKQDLSEIYPLMEVDFPPNELKPKNMIEKSLETGFMEGYGFFEDANTEIASTDPTKPDTSDTSNETLLAYAFFVKIEDVLLFDYLAVVAKFRDSGIGSAFLQELRGSLLKYECVIGEVENPDYCEDPEERATMERRIRFYDRNEIRDTGASGCVYGVEYRFVEVEGNKIHSPEEAMERINRFYRTYWPKDEDYRKYVTMH